MKNLLILIILCMFTHSCTLWRGIQYGGPDIYDYKNLAQDTILRSNQPFSFAENKNDIKLNKKNKSGEWYPTTLDTILMESPTVSFLIIRNDTILFENYYKGFNRSTISTLFSVSKSITSLLTGIAIKDGYIKSVHDPVTNYIPELKKRDPMFQKLTIEHLLDMRAGLKFNEDYSWNPFSKIGRLYYGNNQQRLIKSMKFQAEPGSEHDYNSMVTAILGVVLERAIKQPLAKYAQEKVWEPLGMEYNAQISLDNKRHRSAKTFGGFATNAIDLAKIGRLYLNYGNYNGKQIVDSAWVKRSMSGNTTNKGYSYCWYKSDEVIRDSLQNTIYFPDSLSVNQYIKKLGLDSNLSYYAYNSVKKQYYIVEYQEPYYALGIFNQVLYVDPRKNLIMVRLGENADMDYQYLMRKISKSRF